MARVYLETSFVSACVTDRTDARSVYRHGTSLEWWQKQRSSHEVFVSSEVLAELGVPGHRGRAEALELIRGVPQLEVSDEVVGFAGVLVSELAMPRPAAAGDALHVAVATLHGMDYVLTWNVRHLANPNKIEHLRKVCFRFGRLPPTIVTPEFLWEASDDPTSE
ncbi:MAG: type II toxin-antitoxin system VapC family toxin [Phycisphaerales bacterium]